MNRRDTFFVTSRTNLADDYASETFFKKLPPYIICTLLGIFSGLTSIAITLGLLSFIQTQLAPQINFSPSALALTGLAAFLSLGTSWLLDKLAQRTFPYFLSSAGDRGVQLIFMLGVLTSLLQGILFLYK